MTEEEELIFTTVRLDIDQPDGSLSRGTGFFFLFTNSEGALPAIVTNKHVVGSGRQARLLAHRADDQGRPLLQSMEVELLWDDYWIDHPDPEVDLCVFPIGGLLERAKDQGQPLFFRALSADSFPVVGGTGADALSPIEETIMIGYPIGLRDDFNNRPIVRQGVTATDARLDYNGRPQFLIDTACFPGSSGSPVFQYNRLGAYAPPEGGLLVGKKLVFLGILFAGPTFNAEGAIEVRQIPTTDRVIAATEIPTNLGYVIHARKLLEFGPILEARAAEGPGR